MLDERWKKEVIDRFIRRYGIITPHNYIRYLLCTLVMLYDENQKSNTMNRYLIKGEGKHEKENIAKRCERLMRRL